jgi:hypothetical protein
MITLAEELILLAIEDDGAISYTAGAPGFAPALISAYLVELSTNGRIDADLSTIRVLSSKPTGLPAEDKVLEALAAGPAQSIEAWLQALQASSPALLKMSLGLLVSRGILAAKDSRFMWVLQSRRYPVVEGREQKEAKLRVLGTLLGTDIPTPHDSALVGLARAAQLLEGFLTSAEISRLEERISLVGGIDLFVKAAEAAIRAESTLRATAFMSPMF